MPDQGNQSLEQLAVPEIPKELAKQFDVLEQKFIRAEVDQIRSGIVRFRPLLKERDDAIAKSPLKDNFWIRVIANSPPEIDEYILESDAEVLGTSLKNLSVERFEVDQNGHGEPRSFRLTFEFHSNENQHFENEKLVKEFYWRKQITRTAKGKKRSWEGLVSEPVRINWKAGKDLTKGLLDAACDLAEAEKKKKGDRKELPELQKLQEKIQEAADANDKDVDEDDFSLGAMSPAGTSFFSFFGYRGRTVSAEESQAATKEDDERYEKLLKGETVDDEDEDDDDDDDEDEDTDEDIEIFPDGDGLAIALAEDLYTHAFKYFGQSIEDVAGSDIMDGDVDIESESDEEGEDQRPRKKAKV
ncbi:hypothetical protein EYZ11_008451 [Aspergillus tanneri]|uniref:Uncharacterized protein n=1 Tax=Aspergillus tanneri TaxID=1220188 RepID=A0A4S3JAK9_9EURO|nr:uncharacterized protein ATNIH1004_009768 [Aspergillus tanneri]KAA8643006.1 hypothetical protein ATNIH1004_009768 [Aspergillus tanneri]THC92070.1 hypothetical protein EYZ11_008451 [Aspergillus tanneri]